MNKEKRGFTIDRKKLIDYLAHAEIAPELFAQQIGISKNTLYDLLYKDKQQVYFSTIVKIAKGLGINPHDLVV